MANACRDPRFVGGHPLAGAEVSGVEHARADLFDDATWYLTPAADAQGVVLERLHRLLSGLGARPVVIDADAHDRLMAAVSHLPHVLANVLVARAAGALGDERVPATGPSFRDATRVAGANPPLWNGIYAANAPALADELDGAIAALEAVRDDLRAGADLTAWQQRASAGPRRAALPRSRRARCASCARWCPTGRASSPRSRWRSAARASTSPTWPSARRPGGERGEIAVSVPEARAERGGRAGHRAGLRGATL